MSTANPVRTGLKSIHKLASIVRLKFLLSLSLLLAWPNFSYAAKDYLTPEYKKCIKAHDDNRSWAICGDDEIKRQESFLADTWKTVFDDMKEYESINNDNLLASLTREQENWKKYKDSVCQYYYSLSLGRESAVLAFPSCKAEVIAERVMTLRDLSKDIEEKIQH
jgi:uncharacterized protein YecT (DUF1311 family)